MTGLTTADKETVQGMSKNVLPTEKKRTLNEFLNQNDLNDDHLNRQRLEALQDRKETRWTTDGVVIICDTVRGKTDVETNNTGGFYDHADDDYVWGHNFVFAQYADDKTTYPLVFRRYEENSETKQELATDLIDETHRVGVPADTYLFDDRYCTQELIEHTESYDRNWISVLESHSTVEYGGEEIRVETLAERIDTTDREVNDETYYIWTKKLPVSKLGERKVLIAEKEMNSGDNDKSSMKYLITNMIDAPAAYLLRTHSMNQRIETFFENTKQDLSVENGTMRP